MTRSSEQRLTATVTHSLWKLSKQVFVESYRILHDQPVQDALYKGEALIRTLAITDQPRLGPLHLFRRPLDPSMAAENAIKYFAGNSNPYSIRYDPLLGPPQRPEPETAEDPESEASRSLIEDIHWAMNFQRFSVEAPAMIDNGDVLWDFDNLIDSYGVRYLHVENNQISEVLDVVSLPHACRFRHDAAWEILEALSLAPETLLAMEYQQAVVHLNNRKLFQVRRRSRLTDNDYVRVYVGA